MNNLLKYIICCLLSLSAVSCHQVDIVLVENDDIVLNIEGAAMTKADDTSAESYISHVDVLVFNTSEVKLYHERVECGGATSFTLGARRSDFDPGVDYYVYLVANAAASASEFAGLSYLQDLRAMVQEDEGLMFANVGEAAHYFLMDAVAYTGSSEPTAPGAVELYDGVLSNSTYLNATLRRAAAKVYVTIHEGQNVTFADAASSTSAAYYMRNCPSSTTVIDGYDLNPVLVTPEQPAAQNDNFVWGENQVTVAAYGYEYNWKDQSVHDKETSLIVNIPMMVNGELHANNWYKVPVCKDSALERNHIYSVDVTINALGATNQDDPQEIDEVRYDVIDWEDVDVNVAQGSGTQYLQLNTNHVNMYNVNVDNSTLTFASSSPIRSIVLNEAYFYNYLDQKVDVASRFNTAYRGINATWEPGALNGAITINSPFVSKSDVEIESQIAQLGPIPVVPEEPAVPLDPEKTEPDPQEIVDSYNSKENRTSRYIAYRTNQNGEIEFYATGNSSTGRRNAQSAQREYNQAYAEYMTWGGLSDDEKKAKKDEYESELASYNDRYKDYQDAVAALNAYNNQVEAIRSAAGQNTHSNAIRYMTFTVTNDTGQTAVFTVAQLPTLYITNEMGSYSYREDFGGTNYKKKGNPNYSAAHWNNNSWTYSDEASNSYFFGSKVALGSEGNYSINYAYWEGNSVETDGISGLNNPRMYHVHITATSRNYVVARPRLDANGYTERSQDNSRLVSPSFMIASQLGATLSPSGGIDQAESHCERYIEVTKDGTEYSDWRLPTAAEIDIIIQHQDISDAMAVVLSGSSYYCSWNMDGNNRVIYTKATGKNGSQNAVRCIRDAY